MFDAQTEANVQSLVFTGFGRLPCAVMLTLRGLTSGWLNTALPRLAFGRRQHDLAAQLLLSPRGLKALGASGEDLQLLGREFLRGASSAPSRARLGDVEVGDRDESMWSGRDHDGVLLLYAKSTHELESGFADLLRPLTVLETRPLSLPAHKREHFGFRDGISNVALARANRARSSGTVVDGEVLLGHPDQLGRTLKPGPLGHNGTFVVLRELEQDVGAFWKFWRQISEHDDEAVLLAAKAVGRWPNGMPLRCEHTREPAFDKRKLALTSFSDDAKGRGCPLGSHVRRVHPRDTLVDGLASSNAISALHRILRRGRNYGPPAPESCYPKTLRAVMGQADTCASETSTRGLMFVGLCTDLQRQFEFILQNWANFPKHANLFHEVDPVLRRPSMPDTFAIPSRGITRYLRGVGGWVRPQGCGYYLLPSRLALVLLAEGAR